MGTKAQYVVELMEQPLEYPEAALEAVKEFKAKNLKLRNLPEAERLPGQLTIMHEMIDKLSDAYNITRVNFNFLVGWAYFNRDSNTIYLGGKFSIITCLHEFAHALRFHWGLNEGRIKEETIARHWSVLLFKTLFPIAYENLVMWEGSTGPHDFCLVRPR